jgi:hypothetical protein
MWIFEEPFEESTAFLIYVKDRHGDFSIKTISYVALFLNNNCVFLLFNMMVTAKKI